MCEVFPGQVARCKRGIHGSHDCMPVNAPSNYLSASEGNYFGLTCFATKQNGKCSFGKYDREFWFPVRNLPSRLKITRMSQVMLCIYWIFASLKNISSIF